MQKTVQSISQISFYFFLAFGLIHICSAILVSQGITGNFNMLIFRTLDLPFLFAALAYGGSKLSLKIEEITGELTVPVVVCSFLSIVIFLAALYFNFALPDAKF